eukprot:CAMPEP_0118996858 /NCGR_PEP_ID=MMETSP1173-20130426/60809_1 /TAXON_ID=1034831 /ORGANISM="Rhizochromulina marina cf, Strain CCMP1243" /LENGTH=982 /DNA_ID=CAMNT_0006948263 /DNA_START=160 /DNA_END=3104 /DNA_ORIENTATION=+
MAKYAYSSSTLSSGGPGVPGTPSLLLESLKGHLQGLTLRSMGVPTHEGAQLQPVPTAFDSSVKEVRQVLAALEQCIFHGLRVEEFDGVFPFWALVERLETTMSPPDLAFNNTVGAVAAAAQLRTPVGRSRGWVRQALNTKQLHHCLVTLRAQQRYLQAFWHQQALLRCEESASLLLPLVQSLEAFDFSIAVEDSDLNAPGPWKILADEPKQFAPPSSQAAPSSSSAASKATPMPSILTSWEDQDMDRLKSRFQGALESLGGHLDRFAEAAGHAIEDFEKKAVQAQARKTRFPATGGQSSARVWRPAAPTGLWGVALERLASSEKHCRNALLSPPLSVPVAFENMMGALEESIDTPQLFRRQVSPAALEAVRNYFAHYPSAPVPPGYDPHVVAASLLAYLGALPDPLCTNKRYAAFMACADMAQADQLRVRLRTLLQELPPSHRCVACRLFRFLHSASCEFEHRSCNDTTPLALSLCFAPVVLCPPASGSNDEDAAMAAAASGGAAVIQAMVQDWPAVGALLEREIEEHQRSLQLKCLLWEGLQGDLAVALDLSAFQEHRTALLGLHTALTETAEMISSQAHPAVEDPAPVSLAPNPANKPPAAVVEAVTMMGFSEEWALLALRRTNNDADAAVDYILEHITEMDDLVTASDNGQDVVAVDTPPILTEGDGLQAAAEEPEPDTINEWTVASSRCWVTCGMARGKAESAGVVDELRGGGLLVVKCLTHFALNHKDMAARLLAGLKQRHRRLSDCPVSMVCVLVLRVLSDALHLTPTPDFSDTSPSAIAHTTTWKLLDHPDCTEELFSLALVMLDDLATSGLVELGEQLGALRAQMTATLSDVNVSSPTAAWNAWVSQGPDREGLLLRQLETPNLLGASRPTPPTPPPKPPRAAFANSPPASPQRPQPHLSLPPQQLQRNPMEAAQGGNVAAPMAGAREEGLIGGAVGHPSSLSPMPQAFDHRSAPKLPPTPTAAAPRETPSCDR